MTGIFTPSVGRCCCAAQEFRAEQPAKWAPTYPVPSAALPYQEGEDFCHAANRANAVDAGCSSAWGSHCRGGASFAIRGARILWRINPVSITTFFSATVQRTKLWCAPLRSGSRPMGYRFGSMNGRSSPATISWRILRKGWSSLAFSSFACRRMRLARTRRG
jgi:hypothetical protein